MKTVISKVSIKLVSSSIEVPCGHADTYDFLKTKFG